MPSTTNPFHTLYLTENVTDIDIPLMFSPVLVPFVAPLYLPGNVVLRGMQGTGKTMLLSLLETNVRLAFWANENGTSRREKISISDPLPVTQRRFVGAGINLSKSYASTLNEIVASDDRDENIRLTRAYFGDYLNCWVLRDLLASLEALITKAPAERRQEVGICDDAAIRLDVLAVDLGHDKRHIGLHAESARVVHDHAAGLGGDGCEFLRDASAGAKQRDVDARERIFGQFLDRHVVAAKFQLLADGTGGGEQRQFAHGKIALLERFNHLDADGPRRADHCHLRVSVHKGAQI